VKGILYSIVVLILVIAAHQPAAAFPRFAQRLGASCQSCHVNPTGGGMRNVYGVTYGQETLPVREWREETGMENFSTQLSEVFSFGADFRTRIVYRSLDRTTSFLQTQGDLYFAANVNKKLTVYLDKGVSSGTEVFGILKMLPAHGYVKIGRFTPAYGIRLEDRNNRAEDTGFELGLAPGDLTLSGGVFNGSGDDTRKVLAARAEGRAEIGEVKVNLGGSVLRTPSATATTRLLGAFGGVSVSDLTIFGEADFRKDESSAGDRKSLLTYAEADYLVHPGVDLKVIYEYSDPDVDVKSGSFTATSFGFEFFPVAGLEVKPLFRLQKEEPVDLDNNEFHCLFHFYL
jgi:hypothetical protein